ncbi:putative transposase [Xenorhabdus japonica]|uniref:Putative transposase n=1 Tax=Xenorhabdus japonica TaxID=53341 RepID=A0A1I5E5T8_9GAMM|nr:putative transposase [Xenorhabdus japonica]
MVIAKGVPLGRWLAEKLMAELGLVSRQQPKHKYARRKKEHVDIPNQLNQQFAVTEPNQVWCGDVTFIWTGKLWTYLAVVIDLMTQVQVNDNKLTTASLIISQEIIALQK